MILNEVFVIGFFWMTIQVLTTKMYMNNNNLINTYNLIMIAHNIYRSIMCLLFTISGSILLFFNFDEYYMIYSTYLALYYMIFDILIVFFQYMFNKIYKSDIPIRIDLVIHHILAIYVIKLAITHSLYKVWTICSLSELISFWNIFQEIGKIYANNNKINKYIKFSYYMRFFTIILWRIPLWIYVTCSELHNDIISLSTIFSCAFIIGTLEIVWLYKCTNKIIENEIGNEFHVNKIN